MKFGIDFGTSFSTMCALDASGKPIVLRDEVGLDKIPSIVYWGEGGVKVGQAAADILGDTKDMGKDEKIETRGRIIKSVKRELEPGRTIILPDGKQITPVDVVSEILRYLKRNAEELHFHTTIKEVSLTHPATFTEAQKNLLTKAAKKAGFSSVKLMPEPIAAALGYVASGANVGNGVIVFDFGGGTFDLAYLQKDADGDYHFPIQPLGDHLCGGDDLDQCIYDWAESEIKEKYGCAIADGHDVDLSFLMLCRRAKERLSRSDDAPMRYFIENIGRFHATSIKKINFEEMIKSKVDRTISLVSRMMNTLEGRNLPVDTVLLVGGSTRIPLVAAKLKEMFPENALIRTTDTDTAVVMGSVYEMPKTEIPSSEKSSRGGDVEAMFRLGSAYAMGSDGMPMDEEEALHWLKKAASHGHSVAKLVLEDIGDSGHKKPSFSNGKTKTITLPGGAEMEMIYCAPGSFMMGSPEDEEDRCSGEDQHKVTLTKGFWLGKYPVTQAQWKSVMGSNPSHFKGDDNPVDSVSWNDCKDFISEINSRSDFTARFPTEAEWEYACRAGTTTAYHWGDALNGDRANCAGNYPCGTRRKGRYLERTSPVGSYDANPWGFYDMHGNVWEWCADWYGSYPTKAVTDPKGPMSGGDRVLRGGSWNDLARNCRSAGRGSSDPGYGYYYYGFRLCCSAGPHE